MATTNRRIRAKLVSLEEPRTMARVQGMIEAVYPGKPYNVWLAPPSHPFRRHIAVKFGGTEGTIEAFGATWLEALEDIEVMRAEMRRSSKTKARR